METDWLVRTDVLNDCDKLRDLTVLKNALVEADPLRETLVLTDSLKDWDKLCDLTVLKDALVETD